jgi:hypothetical protein
LPILRTLLVALTFAVILGLTVAAVPWFIRAFLGIPQGDLLTFLQAVLLGPGPARIAAGLAAGVGFLLMLLLAWIVVRGARPAEERVAPGEPVHRRDPAVALLAVLQREGRLIDFLREKIEPYSDEQVGAAVRSIHESCRKALDEHLSLEPVRSEEEGEKVEIENGFDPSAIRLTGKVSGKPPFRGTLRHRGWRTSRIELPADPLGQDPTIVFPAEIEVG